MKNGRLQCKDLPDQPIIDLLSRNPGVWHIFGPENQWAPTIDSAFPAEIPFKLKLAKMASMIRRRIVQGCDCGCRGDFYLTEHEGLRDSTNFDNWVREKYGVDPNEDWAVRFARATKQALKGG